MNLLRIAFIGAVSIVFGINLLTDILTYPSLRRDTVIILEDINQSRLDLMYKLMQMFKEKYPDLLQGISFEKTTDLKTAIMDAKYIICAIHVGGLDAFKLDIEIPFKYGVSQCVGDTLGPGGIFRFLRQSTLLKPLIELINEVGYSANGDTDKPILFNYANPMAMNTWYCNLIKPESTVGLCHGIQDTSRMIRRWINVEKENFSFLCAGINHMAWFLEIWYKNPEDFNAEWKNAYPLMQELYKKNPEIIQGEKLRWDMMEATGYFMTESSGHLSEYLPYYRKRPDLLEKYKGGGHWFNSLTHGITYEIDSTEAIKLEARLERKIKRKLKLREKPTDEYVSHIINAIESNIPFVFNGNVMNKEGGIITNLPPGCCVEVPVFADHQGLHPQGGIKLPTVCQALNISNILVQKATIEGVIESNKEKIYHAVLLDPNTASVCSPKEVRNLVDEMFEAEKQWLPKFD